MTITLSRSYRHLVPEIGTTPVAGHGEGNLRRVPRTGTEQNEQGLASDHSSFGGFGDCRACLRFVARNCSPYCRTIATAGFKRIPTAPRSSTKAHSVAIRLTTSSAVNIGGIPLPPPSVLRYAFTSPGLSLYRRLSSKFLRVISELEIWRAANLLLKRYGDKAGVEGTARADALAAAGDHAGEAVWRRITHAVAQLANKTPPGPVY